MRTFSLPDLLSRRLLLLGIACWAAGCSKPVESIRNADPSLVSSLPPVEFDANDWPVWRGPNGDNHAQGSLPPLTWSRQENVLWRTELPGAGHASPCVWQDRVFIATADDRAETQSLLCFARADGESLWSKQIHQGGFIRMHNKNTHASPTPACDGQRVFTVFAVQDAVWATAVDIEGEIVWQKKVGDFRSRHGYGSSPLIYQSLVIIAADHEGGGYLAALHRETGETVWRTPRDRKGSYSSPTLASHDGKDLLLLGGQKKIIAYDPKTGEEVWSSEGPADTISNTIAWSDPLAICSGGYPQRGITAVHLKDGQQVWSRGNVKLYVPSPLIVGDLMVAALDNGVVEAMRLDSGKTVWKQRAGGDISASPAVLDGHIFLPTERGEVLVFQAGEKYVSKAKNSLGENIYASPVICGGQLFLRTRKALYCIAHPQG